MPGADEPWQRVVTADGALGLALHRFDTGVDHSGTTPAKVVLLSHATGFHAHCYQPVAAALPDEWVVIGLDHRGHGYSAPDPSAQRLAALPTVEWAQFGSDVVTVAEWLCEHFGVDDVVGFGHSMGAAALVWASVARPERFSSLVLFEPIAPSELVAARARADGGLGGDNSLAAGALRRRRSFESHQAALENYAAKPPLSLVRPEVLDNYVRHGFAPSPEGVTLRCSPEYESATFVGAYSNGVWEIMPDASTPTVVAAGVAEPHSPGEWASDIAGRMGNAELRIFSDQTHFGPFTDPEACADLIIAGAS